MRIEVLDDAGAAAEAGARHIAAAARGAVAARGRFTLAVSGGSTPWRMLEALADLDVPWQAVHVFQVDEREAPDGHPDRNLTGLHEALLGRAPLAPERVHAMPVAGGAPLEAAATAYAARLVEVAGDPPSLDVVHLGLGGDGHTASLVPGDPVLEVEDRYVAVTLPYQERRRMTLTYPVLAAAREVLWLAPGAGKADVIPRLARGDASIPAGRVRHEGAVLFTDRAAAANLPGR